MRTGPEIDVVEDAVAEHVGPVLIGLDEPSGDGAAAPTDPVDGAPRPTSVLTGFASIDLARDRRTNAGGAGSGRAGSGGAGSGGAGSAGAGEDDDGLAFFKRRSPGRPAKHSAAHAARGSREGATREGLTREGTAPDELGRDGLGSDGRANGRRDGRGRAAHQAGKRRPQAPEEALGSYSPAADDVGAGTPIDGSPGEPHVAAPQLAAPQATPPPIEADPTTEELGHDGQLAADALLAAESRVPAESQAPADASAAVTADYVAGRVDVFDRTLRVAVAEARLRLEALGRHVPVLRRIVGAGQSVLLVARCGRLDQSNATDHLMVVTRDRVVVMSESRSLHRTRVHLNAAVAALLNVRWQPDVGSASVEFAATALDGVRERFLIEAPDAAAVSHVDAVLGYVFRPAGTRRFNPVEPVMPSWMNPAGAYH